MELPHLDAQLALARKAIEHPQLNATVWSNLATAITNEVAGLDEASTNKLRLSLMVPAERYLEELSAFQAWTEIAEANRENPVIVRARVMTELYVSFVWLRDSVMKPTAAVLPDRSTFGSIEEFLSGGNRRLLRNAIAHGRWSYLPDFSGLEYWAEPTRNSPHEPVQITNAEYGYWTLLSRGASIALLLAITNSE